MASSEERITLVRNYFKVNEYGSMRDLLRALDVSSRMTVSRTLNKIDYISSYSHRGKFYSTMAAAEFDQYGLWTIEGIHFSRFGTLLSTAKELVMSSESGFTASELTLILGVECKHALLNLSRKGMLDRTDSGNGFVYLSMEPDQKRRQILSRKAMYEKTKVGLGPDLDILPDEMRAAIILFFSLLDERQRRLFAGMEAARLGYGGDRRIADLLGMSAHTVSKGRRELFGGDVESGRIRAVGGGNKKLEKKRRK